MIAIVVNVFVKDDMIQNQIDNILQVKGIEDVNVIFYQDSIVGSQKYNTKRYEEKNNNLELIIKNNLSRFKNSEYHKSQKNMTCYGLCKFSLDYAFEKHDFCIFLEDDVFLSKDSLNWFLFFYNNKYISHDNYSFITGESIYYNTKNINKTPDNRQIEYIIKYTKDNCLVDYFMNISNHLTSSIFATTKQIWKGEISEIRGSPLGDCKLNKYINKNKLRIIFPIVPRAKDVGMLHDDGWSVAYHGKDNVSEIKNTYILSDSFEIPLSYKLLRDFKDISKVTNSIIF